jgi:hypothetical protein
MYLRMAVALAGARTVERILFTFGIHELVRYRSPLGQYSAIYIANQASEKTSFIPRQLWENFS